MPVNNPETTKQGNKLLTSTVGVFAAAALCNLLWGSAFPVIKIGYEVFGIPSNDFVSQILFAGIRFMIAGVMGIAMGSVGSKKLLVPKRNELSKVFLLCIFQTILQYVLFYIGLSSTSGVKASVIEGANVFAALLVSGLIFRMEKVTGRKLAGCAVGFAGVVLVNLGSGFDMSFSLTGEGFILLSTLSYAFSTVLMKHYSSQGTDPVMLSGWQFLFGGGAITAAGIAMGGQINYSGTKGTLLLLYLAAVSACAYSLWSILLKLNPVSRVAVYGFLNPIFGVILSTLLLKEGSVFGGKTALALLLVCLGIYLVNSGKKSQSPEKT